MKWYSSARNRAHVATIFFKTVANNNLREVDFHCIFLVTHQSNICENVVSNYGYAPFINGMTSYADIVKLNFFFLEACLEKLIELFEYMKA